MPPTPNSSSSPGAEGALVHLPLARLHAHPANANRMAPEQLATLRRHLARAGRCPPLIVRPHPTLPDQYEMIDGHQRAAVAGELGWTTVPCVVWACDDDDALLLLATLNTLRGADAPGLRASLLADLADRFSADELAALLPEDATEIAATLQFAETDPERLIAELEAAAQRELARGPQLLSFTVEPEDVAAIEAALAARVAQLSGPNRRGRALAQICRADLEVRRA